MALITNRSYVDKDVMLYGRNTYDTTTTPSNQVKIVASDATTDDYFGRTVAVGSGRIVVGAYGDDDLGTISGAAYIFNLSGTQLAKIKASDGAGDDLFGYSVAVGSGRIVVGAYADDISSNSNQGSAYIFNLNGTQLAKITASDGATDDYFGWSVAVDCGRIVVGAYQDDVFGSAYIFDLNGNQLAKIRGSDTAFGDRFGYSVSIGSGRIVIGASQDGDLGSQSGSAYIFDLNGNQLAKIKASDGASGDQFGYSVAVGSGRIVVGAIGDDDSGSNSGSAYIFDLNGTQLAKIRASDVTASSNFGSSVSVGLGRVFVGAAFATAGTTSAGAVYVFTLNGTQLAKISEPATSLDTYGVSVAVGSGCIVVGASGDDPSGLPINSGAAYIYTTPNQPHILDILDNN